MFQLDPFIMQVEIVLTREQALHPQVALGLQCTHMSSALRPSVVNLMLN